jgi:RNA polymerase sigma-70 factor, ECF subfamily
MESSGIDLLADSPSLPVDIGELRANLLRAVRKCCPRWLASDAEDLAQIAVTRALARVSATDGGVEFTPGYLYRIAFSVIIDEIRRRRRRRETALPSDDPPPSPAAGPERLARAREVRSAIVASLAAMNPARRRAATLHLLGHTLAEIAALLDCNAKKAQNLVYRGMADLRAALKAQGIEP